VPAHRRIARPGRRAACANRCAHCWPGGSAPWRPAGTAGRDGRSCSWRWPPAVTAGPHRTVSRSRIAGRSPRAASAFIFACTGRAAGRPRAADPLGSRFRITTGASCSVLLGGSLLRCRWRRACGARGRRPRCRHGGAVAVQDCTGEGASCRARVSSTSSKPWNGRSQGLTLPVGPPGNRLIAKPLLAPALRAALPPWCGGCWPRCSAASAVPRAQLAGAAGESAARRGRTKHSPSADSLRGVRRPLWRVLHDYFAWATTTTMARYPDSAEQVPEGMSIPRWSWDGLQR
jgi:hypothetical protein